MATTATITMAAVAPARLEAHPADIPYTMDSGDMDAEGEDDPEMDFAMGNAQHSELVKEAEASDGAPSEDSEVVEDEDDEDDEDEVPARSMKRDKGKQRAQSDEDVVEDIDEGEESSAAEEDGSEKDDTDGESAVAEDWEADSEEGEDAEVEVANRNKCM